MKITSVLGDDISDGLDLSTFEDYGFIALDSNSEAPQWVVFIERKSTAQLRLASSSRISSYEDIKENGIVGFMLDCTFAENNRPAINVHGLNWESTYDDILDRLGEPEEVVIEEDESGYVRYTLDGWLLTLVFSVKGIQQLWGVRY